MSCFCGYDTLECEEPLRFPGALRVCEKLLLREKLSLCEKLLLIHQRDAVIDVSGVLHTLLDRQVAVLTLVLRIILGAGIYFVIHRAISREGSQLHALDLLLQSAGHVLFHFFFAS